MPFIEYIKWVFKDDGIDNYKFSRVRGSIVVYDNYIRVNSNSSNDHSWSAGEARTLENLDLTDYSKVVVDWEHIKGGNATNPPDARLFVRIPGYNPGKDSDPSRYSEASISTRKLGRYTTELNISDLSGDYSIHVANVPGSKNGNGGWVVNAHNIWLE